MKTERNSASDSARTTNKTRLSTSVRAGEVGAVASAVKGYWRERGYSEDTLGDGMVANAMYNGTYGH
jgi:hypothetical protein